MVFPISLWETGQCTERNTLTNWRDNRSIESIFHLLKISCSRRPPWQTIHFCNLTKFCIIHRKIAPGFVTIPTAVLNFYFLVAVWTSNKQFTLQGHRWEKILGLLISVNVTAKEVANCEVDLTLRKFLFCLVAWGLSPPCWEPHFSPFASFFAVA